MTEAEIQENDLTSQEKLPAGMIILMVYLGYSLIMNSVSIASPILLFGPFLLPRVLVVVYYSFSAIITGFCLWSVFRRKAWGQKLIILWYWFGILYAVMNSILSFYLKDEFLDIYKKIFSGFNLQTGSTMLLIIGLIFPLIFVLLINGL